MKPPVVNPALVAISDRTITKPSSPVAAKRPMYWTKAGVTIFFFRDDWVPPETELVLAKPGMVGVSWRGDALFNIMADGECVKLTQIDDDFARNIVGFTNTVDQLAGEVTENV